MEPEETQEPAPVVELETVKGDLAQHIIETVARYKEPMGFEGWQLNLVHGPLPDAKASCEAQPEYKRAVLSFDLAKLETGDELDEIIAHEMSHMHTWPQWDVAEDIADLAAPGNVPLQVFLAEQIRRAGEDVTTQVGFMAIRLLRRLDAADRELTNARTELKLLRKQVKQLAPAPHID